jgi:glycosyltransferase involved in cell wall biosynthesis
MMPPRTESAPPLGVLVKIYPKLSETFILEEILGLERLGLTLRLYALSPATDAITHPAVAQVRAPLLVVPAPGRASAKDYLARHTRLLARSPRRYALGVWQALQRGRRGLDDFLRAGWLSEQLRRDGVEHLHSHFIAQPTDVAQLAAQLGRQRYSISAHAKDIYLSTTADLRRRLSGAAFTVTCTELNRSTLAAIAPQARVHRMYHGIDQALFHPSRRRLASGEPLIVSVGRLREKKGLDVLIEACARLRDAGQAFRCEIVGYGPEHAALQALIDRYALGEQVVLVGKLTREQVIERYSRATVYVQPSRIAADGDRDGIPNVLLEAMAMGVPVIASCVSGIPELVADGHNGVLVAPDDADALARAVMRLLSQPTACAELACRGRTTVEQGFDNDRNLRQLCDLLREAGYPAAGQPTAGASLEASPSADAAAWSHG